jgi:uncharacterized membrane protein
MGNNVFMGLVLFLIGFLLFFVGMRHRGKEFIEALSK